MARKKENRPPKVHISAAVDVETKERLEMIARGNHISAAAVMAQLIWNAKLPEAEAEASMAEA